MRRTTSKAMLTVVFAGFLAFGSFLALAQEKPADNMQIVRDKVAADKKPFIATHMGLTEAEAKAFWPVYESYQGELAHGRGPRRQAGRGICQKLPRHVRRGCQEAVG